MSKQDLNENLMFDLQSAVIKELLARIKSGEASPQDMKNAVQLLKDNGITVETKKGDPSQLLSEALPFETEDFTMVN